ncbi:MAG TPA: hypothetical protein VGI03_16495 [Verrucomicrobiae bacterium]
MKIPFHLIVFFLVAILPVSSEAKGSYGTNTVVYAAAEKGDVTKLKEYFATNSVSPSVKNDLLRVTVVRGEKEAAEFLISQGADVNQKGFFEMNLLAILAESIGPYGFHDAEHDQICAEMAEVLIDNGTKVDAVDNYSETPLQHAVEFEKGQLVETLLKHGADQKVKYEGVNEGSLLHMAIINHDMPMVAVLLKFNPPFNVVDQNGATPLLLAEEQNETEIAAMIRTANPGPGDGFPGYSVPPTIEEMQALGRRVADGDPAAFDELANTAQKLYGEIKNYQKEHARVMVLLGRMMAAFNVIGEEAGNGNDKALQVLEKCLTQRGHLKSFAPEALGTAAASGNKQALDILLHYDHWGIPPSTVFSALAKPAKANVEPAVDYFANGLAAGQDGYFVNVATNALATAADLGNQTAKDALVKYASVSRHTNE